MPFLAAPEGHSVGQVGHLWDLVLRFSLSRDDVGLLHHIAQFLSACGRKEVPFLSVVYVDASQADGGVPVGKFLGYHQHFG